MKQFLLFLLLSFTSFSQDSASISSDSSFRLANSKSTFYRLHGLKSDFQMVDTNMRLIVTEPEPTKRIGRDASRGHYDIGSNYDSMQNVNPTAAAIISVSFLLFILYLIFRVRKSLKKETSKRNDK